MKVLGLPATRNQAVEMLPSRGLQVQLYGPQSTDRQTPQIDTNN